MAVSFSNDIMPLFNQFKGQMMWRFDLTNYEQVKANASTILGRITVGRGSTIGGSVWLTHSVPPNSQITQAKLRSNEPDRQG